MDAVDLKYGDKITYIPNGKECKFICFYKASGDKYCNYEEIWVEIDQFIYWYGAPTRLFKRSDTSKPLCDKIDIDLSEYDSKSTETKIYNYGYDGYGLLFGQARFTDGEIYCNKNMLNINQSELNQIKEMLYVTDSDLDYGPMNVHKEIVCKGLYWRYGLISKKPYYIYSVFYCGP